MNDINEKCSCGSRLRHKCVKESDNASGKMCVKDFSLTAQAKPNDLSVEEAFDVFFNRYEDALDNLSTK